MQLSLKYSSLFQRDNKPKVCRVWLQTTAFLRSTGQNIKGQPFTLQTCGIKQHSNPRAVDSGLEIVRDSHFNSFLLFSCLQSWNKWTGNKYGKNWYHVKRCVRVLFAGSLCIKSAKLANSKPGSFSSKLATNKVISCG